MERTGGMFTDMHEADLDKHVEVPHVLGGAGSRSVHRRIAVISVNN